MPASPGSPTLVLVPTELELRRLEDFGGLPRGAGLVRLCGFGPVAAAARTMQLLAELRPARVLLVGIAGTYDEAAVPIGAAREFVAVGLAGVGAGEGEGFQGPPALGFPQWPGSPGTTAHPVNDTLPLAAGAGARGLLLTTCAASADAAMAARRRAAFPAALCEDMEGFGVALACALARVPLRVVRGASNLVGDRDAAHWRLPAALEAARCLAHEVLTSAWEEPA
ncbi:MAG: futalosine hydrolase [Planctomycetes bacterium]|nr:futalosine hydrolase [Planctomycetota bacterium]